MFSCFDIIPSCDGQMDGQTDYCDSVVRVIHTRRAVKMTPESSFIVNSFVTFVIHTLYCEN